MPSPRTSSRSLITVIGIALGAGLLTAVLILSATMQEAALLKVQTERIGEWDIMVAVPSYGVDEKAHMTPDMVDFIRTLPEVAYAVPQVTVASGSVNTPVQYYLGIGKFPNSIEGNFASLTDALRPGELLLPTSLADQLGVSPGDEVSLPFSGRERTALVAGLVSEVQTGSMPSAFFPYEWLADALDLDGPPGLLLGLMPGVRKEAVVAMIQFEYPELNFELRKSIEELRWQLEGLSFVAQVVGISALLAGAVLALTAFGISVHERTRELALLRAIGAEPRQVKRMLAKEALNLGGIGATAGIVLGLTTSAALARSVGQYLDLGVPFASLTIPWIGLALTFVGTISFTLIGAWPAARRAAQTAPLAAMRPPTSTLENVSQRRTFVGTVALIVAAGFAVGSLWKIPEHMANGPPSMMLGLFSATLLLIAVIVSLPISVPGFGRCTALALHRFVGSLTTLGMRNLERQKVRSGRTAGILVVGTALLVALISLLATEQVDTEVTIFREYPAAGWIKGPWAPPSGYGDDMVASIASIPGVTTVVPVGREVEADLLDYDLDRIDPEYRRLVERRGEPVERLTIQTVDFAALAAIADFGRVEGDVYAGVVLDRNVARRFGIALGDTLRIKPLNGSPVETVPVTALVDHLPQIFNLVTDKAHFRDLYPAGEEYKVSLIDFAAFADRERIADEVRALLADGFAAFSYSDAEEWRTHWRQQIFEQMVMVGGMGVLLLLIAAAGLINTMAANLRERQSELTTLYAIGATPAQLAQLVRAEALVIGGAGSILGVGTAVLMMYVAMGRGIPLGFALQFPWPAIVAGLVSGPLMAAGAAIVLVRGVMRSVSRPTL